MQADSVLKFWFGEDDLTLLKTREYVHKPALWFKPTWETDEAIKQAFATVFAQAEHGELDSDWLREPASALALLILLDQFTRSFYRGRAEMFANEARATQIASDLIANEAFWATYAPIEQLFVYLALSHAENVDLCQQAVSGCENLLKNAEGDERKHFGKYLHLVKVQHDILVKYGRFPQRNDLLARKPTLNELVFLEKSKHNFVKSMMPLSQPNAEKIAKVHSNKEKSKTKSI